jgi:hypothetical protein
MQSEEKQGEKSDYELQLCAFIDSWSISPRIFIPHPNPIIEPIRRTITDDMFNKAILLSQALRAQNLPELRLLALQICQFLTQPTILDTFNDDHFDSIESRNGCEPWQAFLTIKQLALCVNKRFDILRLENPDSHFYTQMINRSVYIGSWAGNWGSRCLIRRYNLPLPNPMDMHLITQILYLERNHSPYSVQCLNQAIRLSSTKYDNLCIVKKIITDYLLHLQCTGEVYHNKPLLQEAEIYLERVIRHIDQRVMTWFNHIERLPLDLQEYIIDLMKNNLTPLDPRFLPIQL